MNDASARPHADDFTLADTNELEDGLSDDLRARVKRELEPGERLLWAARSDPPAERHGVGFYVGRAFTFCLLVQGLFLIVASGRIGHWNDVSPLVVGLGLLGIAGLFVISLVANWNGRRTEKRRMVNTCYAVTDRRAIVWSPQPNSDAIRIQALGRPFIKSLVRIERPDGSGHLDFSSMPEGLEFGHHRRFMFADIPEVRRVEQIVRNNLFTSEQIA